MVYPKLQSILLVHMNEHDRATPLTGDRPFPASLAGERKEGVGLEVKPKNEIKDDPGTRTPKNVTQIQPVV